MAFEIAVIVGSLRKDSLNRKMANAIATLAPESLHLRLVEIAPLSFYNQDLEDTPPADWTKFRDEIRDCDGVIFVTPEYNRSVPGVLKNAIDVGSRPYGKAVWKGKPAAVVSVSPGAMGGFGANHHLRQSLVFVDMPVLQQPEAYVGHAATLFDENGRLTNDKTIDFMKAFLKAYAEWVERVACTDRSRSVRSSHAEKTM